MDEKFRTIEEMGFSRAEAQEALTFARGDLQAALDWLLTNCPQGITTVAVESPKSPRQPGNGQNETGNQNFVPPPPLDASDRENPAHLEALKRNPSNEPLMPSNELPTRPTNTNQIAQPSNPASSPSSSSPNPSSPANAEKTHVAISSELPSAPTIMIGAPVVQVCFRTSSDAPTLAERDKLLALLQSEHIPCNALDLSEQRDVEDVVEVNCLPLPQAVLAFQPLGDLNEFSRNLPALRRFIARKIAQGLQSEHSNNLDEYSRDPISTGAVDGVLNLLQSAASRLWNSTTQPSSKTSHSFIEFTVIKTNWFYRDQRRIIRFGSNGDFYRIEPKTNELRESIPYSSISGITVAPGRLSLTLKTGLQHSFAAPARVIDYMYQLFLAYSPDHVTPKIEAV